MATIQRPVKTYGTRRYVDEVAAAPSNEDPILANEVDGDLDTVYAAWNGGADTVNSKDGAVTKAKLAADANLWTDTGSALTPVTSTRPLVLPAASSQITAGSGTIKAALDENSTGGLYLNTNNGWAPQDAAKASWSLNLDAPADLAQFIRRAPGAAAGTVAAPF